MDYLGLLFFAFLTILVVVYYLVKPKYRYIVLFLGSYFFYGYINPSYIFSLILVTVISYTGGIVINKWRRKSVYVCFFLLEIIVLAVYKYTAFLLSNFNLIVYKMSGKSFSTDWNIILPIGLSFMIFQACTYLSDVYRNSIRTERNIIRYATFVAFFPTVLAGPIQKARELLPQITCPKDFDYEQAKKGTILFVWGAFEKIMVADKLGEVYKSILPDFQNRSSAEILIGAVSFSLYIYADFSSYSDIARGISRLLGINIGKNFNNPYLSCSIAEFWKRWHVSLNEWFVENVYIPLGGNRKGTIRKYFNVLIVFLLSGLWHGANWHFVVWGGLNGMLSIIGMVITSIKDRTHKKIKVDDKIESLEFIRRIIVFYLITLTWMFFNASTMDAIRICKKLLIFNFLSLFDPNLLSISGTPVSTFVTVVATLFFCGMQIKRQNERSMIESYNRQPIIIQCLLLAIVICICIFGRFATDSYVDTRFLYFDF